MIQRTGQETPIITMKHMFFFVFFYAAIHQLNFARSSIYKENNLGDNIPPCLTLLEMAKKFLFPHCINNSHILFISELYSVLKIHVINEAF